MKIQNLIRRKSGSTTTFGGESYSFNDENDHTVEVTDESDIERFLAIPTYRAVDGKAAVEVAVESAAPAAPAVPAKPGRKPGRKAAVEG